MKQLFVLSILLFTSKYSSLIAQTTYYYKGLGDLHQFSSWGSNPDGSGSAPPNFSSSGDVFDVRNIASVSLTSNWSVTGSSSKIIVGNGIDSTELIVPANYFLLGNILVKNAGRLTLKNSTVPTIDSLFLGSTIAYTALSNQALSNKSYYDLEIGGSGSKTSTGDLTVNHQLTVNGILDLNASTEDFLGTCSQIIGNGIMRVTSSSIYPIPLGLTWPIIVEFYRNGNQSIPSGTYKSLVVSGTSGIKSVVGGDLTIDSFLSISTNTTLAIGTNALLGNFTITNGNGVLTTTNTDDQPLPNNLHWTFAVTYSAADAGQTIMSGQYQILNITSGSNTNKSNGDILLLDSGVLQVSSANVLDMGTSFLIFGNAITIGGAGTIRTQNISNNPLPINQTWTQSISYNSGVGQTIMPGTYNAALTINGGNRNFMSNTSIVVKGTFTATSPVVYQMQNVSFSFTGNGNQSINVLANFVFYKLLFSGGGTKTVSSSIQVLSELSIGNSTVVNLGVNTLSGSNFTTLGNSTGLYRTQNNSSNPIPNQLTWNFRVQFDGSSQTIVEGHYWGGVTILGSNSIKSMSGDCDISDTLTIVASNQLVIGLNTLTISGFINNTQTGTITGSASSNIVFNNLTSVANTLYMTQTNVETQTIKNLTLISGSAKSEVLLGNKLLINGILKISNSFLYSNGNLVLTADSNFHAEVSEIIGDGNIIGVVEVQVFVSGNTINDHSRWRFLSSSVQTNDFISANWQTNIHITGEGLGGSPCPNMTSNSNGFDCTSTNNSSFYLFNNSLQSWEKLASTNTTNLPIGSGFRVFIRGRREQGCQLLSSNPPDPQNVVLHSTGFLHLGQITIPCSPKLNGYALIGNPYQATIDWTNSTIKKTNLLPTIYGWKFDASSMGSFASYSTFPVPDSTNGMSRYISPGTGFFVQTNENGNGSLTLTESSKSINNSNPPFLKQDVLNQVCRIQLLSNSQINPLDEIVFRVHPATNWLYNMKEDVKKMANGLYQLAFQIIGDTNKLGIIRVPNLYEQNRIELIANIPSNKTFKIQIELSKELSDSFDFFLFDSFENNKTPITHSLSYNFTYHSLTPRFFIEWKLKEFHLSQEAVIPSNTLSCYPNPASTKLFIQSKVDLSPHILVKNMIGQSFEIRITSIDNNLYTADIALLPTGNYYAEIKTPKFRSTVHFTVIK